MLKFLRSFALAAMFLLPFAAQAQTDCTSLTIPYAENFDAYSGNATSTTAPSGYPAITLPDCWDFLNMSASTSTYPQVFLTSSTSYAVSGNCLFFKSSSSTSLYAVMPAITYSGALQLSFTYRNEGTTASNGTIIVGVMTDATDATTFTAIESCTRTTTKTLKEVTIPAGTLTSGARIAFQYEGGSSNNYYAAIDNVTLDVAPTCIKVTALSIGTPTTNSLTLTWTDAANTGATYSIYNMADTSLVATGISTTSYTVTGLNANTFYTFAVLTDCGGGDLSAFSDPAGGRTSCNATTPLPYNENFSGYSGLPSTPYYGPAVTPACWDYYSNGTNTAETTGSTSYYGGVAQYSSTSSYACLVASNPYLIMPIYLVGSAVTSQTYIDYGTARGNTKIAILPAFTEALNTLQISFDYKMSSSYSSTSYATTLELGYVMGNDYTFTSMQSWNATTTKQSIEELNLSSLAANAPAGARLAFKFSGVHNGTGTSSYGAVYCGIDNVVVESLPNCLRVSDVTASNITANSATIAWIDTINTGATYTIYNMADTSVVAANVSTLTYSVTGLNANTEYQFGVVANCSATDVSEATLVTFRTACASETMPWSETFDNWTTKSPCWQFLSGQFNGGAGAPTTSSSAWTLNSSYGSYITISGKALTMNLYSSNRYWAVTPIIDITSNDVMLSVDVAVSAWSAAAPNYDDNDTLAFAITTDGTTWTVLSVVDYMGLNSMGNTYTTVNIPVTGYNGQSVRFAIYGGSVSGTSPYDNRIAIDNVTVDVAPSCMPVTGLAASDITAHTATLSWNGTASSYNIYNMSDTSLVGTSTTTTFTVNNLTSETNYIFGVTSVCGNDESLITTISLSTLVSCPVPTALTATLTPGDGTVASLSWVENGTATAWQICLNNDMTNLINVTTNSYNLTGLTAEQAYTAKVRAVCGTDDMSAWSDEINFTPTNAYMITVNDGTTTNDYVPVYGLWVDNITKSQFIIPATDLTAMQNGSITKLTFYASQANVPWTNASFEVYVTETTETTVTSLGDYTTMTQVYSGSLSIVNNLMEVTFATPYAYSGGNLKIGFLQTVSGTYASSSWYGVSATDASMGGYGTSISQRNFLPKTTINFVPGSGDDTTDVLTINMTVNDATMGTTTPAPGTYTYNAGDSVIFTAIPNAGYHFVSWNIDYSDYGMGVMPISDSITLAIPVAAEDLGSEFDIIATFASDATACDAVAIPFTEDFEANSTTAACWTTVNTHSSTGINSGSPYTGSQAFRFYYSTNPPQYLISPELSGTTDGVNVSFMYKAQSTSYTETFHVGYSTTTNDTSAFTWGPEISTNMPTWLPYSGTMPAGTKYVAVKYTANDQYYLFIDSVVFDNPPACMPVTALTVYATTANSVTLNWNGTATSYSIYNGSTLVADNITTTNYTISGLTASTGYTFGVVANCGTETSTMETIDARTDCGDGSCAIQIDGTDSYGDGWDGATITVSQNGFTLGTFTVVGSTNTVQYSVCSGIPVTFTWTGSTSSYSYPAEISFEIKDGSGMVGYLLSDATNTANGVIYTMNDPCPSCVAPIVTLDSVTTTDAYISWTGNATSYSIYNGSTYVASTAANTYTFSGLTAGTAYTFGVVAICSADDSSAMATVSVTTEFDCSDITTLPYNYGFESGLACWTTVNGSADGVAWMTTNLAGMTNVAPHSGSLVASSWSWNSTAMHANAWLISPKFVLPTVASGDSLTFSWWEVANANYADSYSVKISTTTNDTTAFTVTARPSTAAAGSWTQQTIDLTAYAGQSVYVAFHHVDYDMNYLLIDDISLYQGAYVPPAPDTLTVTVATMDATMGTTNPAPGTYQYAETETVQLAGVPNSGYHFIGWAYTTDGVNNDTLDANYITVQFPASLFMSTGSVTFTALFEAGNPDSTTITYAVNDATMGTTVPAPGTYTIYVGNSVQAQAVANTGYHLDAWVLAFYDANNALLQSDTVYSTEPDFTNPMNFGTVPQSFADYGYTITVTALFTEGTVEPQEFTLITAVNDATMGTITPAPGTHTYVAGDSILFGFTAAEGYTIGSVDMTLSIMGQTIIDTTLPALYAIAMAQEPLYADDFLGMTMSLTVNFVADTNSSSDVFTLVTAVNNATMGTMTPAPGTHTYNAGDVINFTVTANEGYAFESATMSISYMGTTLQEETVYDLEFTTEPLEIDEEMLGFTMTITVNFKSTQGIENADEANIYAYSKNGNIVLNGAEGREVYVFDINGRNLHHTVKATATETYNVPTTGVYLVKVIGGETIRVVVMR